MTGLWKEWQAKSRLPTLSTSPLEISPNSRRDSHISTAPASVTYPRRNSRQAKNRKMWAVEKWKSKTRIPTFPPPRQPAAARKRTKFMDEPSGPPRRPK